jgi:cytochrome P450
MARDCPIAGPEFSQLLDLEPEALAHQGEFMSRLSEQGPVVWIPELEAFAVTTYSHAVEVLSDPGRFSSQLGDPKGPKMARRLLETRRELAENSEEFQRVAAQLDPDWRQVKVLTTADPPDHSRQRRLVNRLFTPRSVAALEDRVRDVSDELIDGFVGDGVADLVSQFAVGLPLRIIAEQLGFGEENMSQFKAWSDDMVFTTGNDQPTSQDIMRITETLVEMDTFLRAVINDRRNHPIDDFVSWLTHSEDPDDPMSDEERIAIIAILISAGNETTTKLLASGASQLGRCPELGDTLKADPSLIAAFVEEILRLESPLQGIYRFCRNDTELAGVALPAGSPIWVLYGAANRSPEEFVGSATLDLHRSNQREHLAFGRGIHYCVGAPLARLEARVGFSALLDRIHPWKIVTEEMQPSYMLHGLSRLDVSFEAKPTSK